MQVPFYGWVYLKTKIINGVLEALCQALGKINEIRGVRR
jgi:hypothetical protein